MAAYNFNKIFMEIRYGNALFFNDMSKLQLIIDELSFLFPVSNYDTNQKALILANLEKHYFLNIFADRLILDVDRPNDFDAFSEIGVKCMESISKSLNIKQYHRVGMRSIRGLRKKNIGEANNYVKKNFIKGNDSVFSSLGSNLNDYGTSFSFENNGYKIIMNIKANSMQTLEIENNVVKQNEQIFQVLIDSDIFKEGILDKNEINSGFIKGVIEINVGKINAFINTMSVY